MGNKKKEETNRFKVIKQSLEGDQSFCENTLGISKAEAKFLAETLLEAQGKWKDGELKSEKYMTLMCETVELIYSKKFDSLERLKNFSDTHKIPSALDIIHWRKALNITQTELAEQSGFKGLARWENGQTDITARNLRKVVGYLRLLSTIATW